MILAIKQLNADFGSDFNFEKLKDNLQRVIHEKELTKSAEELAQELSNIEKEIEKDEG